MGLFLLPVTFYINAYAFQIMRHLVLQNKNYSKIGNILFVSKKYMNIFKTKTKIFRA